MNDDPGVSSQPAHHLVAVYETEMEADAARVALIKAGLEPGQVQMSNAATPEDLRSTAPADFESKSFWGKLRDMIAFTPPHLHGAFAEGLLRGHAILTVSPPASGRDQMIALLESTGPIDFNARQSEWQASGWQAPVAPGSAAATGGRVQTYATDQITGLPPSPAAGDPSI